MQKDKGNVNEDIDEPTEELDEKDVLIHQLGERVNKLKKELDKRRISVLIRDIAKAIKEKWEKIEKSKMIITILMSLLTGLIVGYVLSEFVTPGLHKIEEPNLVIEINELNTPGIRLNLVYDDIYWRETYKKYEVKITNSITKPFDSLFYIYLNETIFHIEQPRADTYSDCKVIETDIRYINTTDKSLFFGNIFKTDISNSEIKPYKGDAFFEIVCGKIGVKDYILFYIYSDLNASYYKDVPKRNVIFSHYQDYFGRLTEFEPEIKINKLN